MDNRPPADHEAERYVLAVVFQHGDSDMLESLEERMFDSAKCRWVYLELRAMVAAGYPLGDPEATSRWLTLPKTSGRADKAAIPDHSAVFAETVGGYVTPAHNNFYRNVLTTERIRRALYWIQSGLGDRNRAHPDHPLTTLDWLHTQANNLTSIIPDHYLTEDLEGSP